MPQFQSHLTRKKCYQCGSTLWAFKDGFTGAKEYACCIRGTCHVVGAQYIMVNGKWEETR